MPKKTEDKYIEVPLATLGNLPEIDLTRAVEKNVSDSPPPGRPGHTPARQKRRRGGSNSSKGSDTSSSPPVKKVNRNDDDRNDEERMRKEIEDAELVGGPSITSPPAGFGLLKPPDIGKVTDISGTPTKPFTIDSTHVTIRKNTVDVQTAQ